MRTFPRRCLTGSIALALGSILAVGPPSAANEFASGSREYGVPINAYRGESNIRTNPATVTGVGYVHPSQVLFLNGSADFLAIGTTKGLGVSGTNCGNHYGTSWGVYTDGQLNGNYFCNDEVVGGYTAGDIPPFQLVSTTCPGGPGWELWMGSTLWRCRFMGSSNSVARESVAMIETLGTTVDRNIDVKYRNLQVRTGATWGDMSPNSTFVSPSYTVTLPDSQKVNAFLAPLD